MTEMPVGGFMQLDGLADAKPDPLAPIGQYSTTIMDVKSMKSQAGKPMLTCEIRINAQAPGGLSFGTVYHRLSLPAPGDTDKARNFKLLMIKSFLALYQITFDNSGFDASQLVGATSTDSVIEIEEYQGRKQNTLNVALLQN